MSASRSRTFALAGRSVLLVDVLQGVVDALNRGESHIEDVRADQLNPARCRRPDLRVDRLRQLARRGRDHDRAAGRRASKQREPDLSILLHATREIATRLRKGQLVVRRSRRPIPARHGSSCCRCSAEAGFAWARTSTSRSRRGASTPARRQDARGAEGGRRDREACTTQAAGLYRGDQPGACRRPHRRPSWQALEHLPVGQHRARQRARTTRRAGGHRRLGSGRRAAASRSGS